MEQTSIQSEGMVNHRFQIEIQHRFASGFALDVHLYSRSRAIGVMGPSGSGKSSLLLAMAGILRPKNAHIVFQGNQYADPIQRMPPRERNIGLVTQDSLLFPHLTMIENLRFGPRNSNALGAEEHIINMLEIGHLLQRKPHELSGGEQQRTALGRALLSQPELLLADEPFSALDQELKARLLTQLSNHLADTSTAVILASHDAEVVDRLCSTTTHIASGSLLHKE